MSDCSRLEIDSLKKAFLIWFNRLGGQDPFPSEYAHLSKKDYLKQTRDELERVLDEAAVAACQLGKEPNPFSTLKFKIGELFVVPESFKDAEWQEFSNAMQNAVIAFDDLLAACRARNKRIQSEPAEAHTTVVPNNTPVKKKKSTNKGDARTQIVAALTKYHKYLDGSCLNQEPIGNNQLARQAGVSISASSRFFTKEFKGHTKYKACCSDVSCLVTALKMLNQEYSPHILYGDKPPSESERNNNE